MAVPLHCAASAGSIPGRYVRGSAFAPLHRFAMQQAFSLPLPALTGKWRLTGEGLSEGFRIKKYNFNQGLPVATVQCKTVLLALHADCVMGNFCVL